MAVVIRAPDIDDLIEAANGKLIAVIGDVGGKVGIKAVGPAEHIVLQIQLFDVGLFFTGLTEMLPQNVGGLQPESAILFIRPAALRQQRHGLGHIAAFMEGGLIEPVVIVNLIALKVRLHPGQVHGKAVLCQHRLPLLLGYIQQLVAVFIVIRLGQFLDVLALIAVLRESDGVLTVDKLEVADLNRAGKLVDLVSGVIDIKLPGHVRAAGGENGGQRIAQHAAPGVAHVHGAGGVGGDELHHDLLPLEAFVGAVGVPLRFHGVHDPGVPLIPQPEVQKAGAGDLRGGEIGTGEVHVVQKRLCDDTGGLSQRLGRRQRERGSIIAVGRVLGNLHRSRFDLRFRQCSVRRRGPVGRHSQRRRLFLCILDHVRHIVKPFLWLK